MQLIDVRNVHQALPEAIRLLAWGGIQRESRNGGVIVFPTPVVTRYREPTERVEFWAERDSNPFFHLFESLWMLGGRNDVGYVASFVSNMANFSDDGETFHGAYGHRWRRAFGFDQLEEVIDNLRVNSEDRRQVVGIWHPPSDLQVDQSEMKDLPCNLTVHFQINFKNELDMTVFNRSNDIVWGCYGANAVHFSVLLEYMAAKIGVPVGNYWQVSCNWHGYLDTLEPLRELEQHCVSPETRDFFPASPYHGGEVKTMRLVKDPVAFDRELPMFLDEPDAIGFTEPFLRRVCVPMYRAYRAFQELDRPQRYTQALEILETLPDWIDWGLAARNWITRRQLKWERANDDGVSP